MCDNVLPNLELASIPGPQSDKLYLFLVNPIRTLFFTGCLETLADKIVVHLDELLYEHYLYHTKSRLYKLVPDIGPFFTHLPFQKAFDIYNRKYRITSRLFIPPTVTEIRHILNIAQVVAIRSELKLVTFDADETLYPNGSNFKDLETAQHIISLLLKGIYIAIVTAAGYEYETSEYENRFKVLLDIFKLRQIPKAILRNFYVFGGECNYLFRCGEDYKLECVPDDEWYALSCLDKMEKSNIIELLNISENTFVKAIDELCLRVNIIRKKRAVGMVPGGDKGRARKPIGSGKFHIKSEILEEVVNRVKYAISNSGLTIPYCAFNGGWDVWVDIGNKEVGIKTLQKLLKIEPKNCLHIGDQFSISGNDRSTRNCSTTVWIKNPSETNTVLRSLLRTSSKADSRQPIIPDFSSEMEETFKSYKLEEN